MNLVHSALIILAILVPTLSAADLRVVAKDSSGGRIPGAECKIRLISSGSEHIGKADAQGEASFPNLGAGSYELTVQSLGFASQRRQLQLSTSEVVEFELLPSTVSQSVVVGAGQIAATPEDLSRLPGSIGFVSNSTLTESRVFTTDEALRKVSGVHARAEEGFGLRPNIGIRGLNPNRSSKLLLLEDGLPLSYAPYGDNASYYHPPIDRFDNVEVLKGGGQILYGPMTVGGVVNYITPPPPAQREGAITIMGGNRDYFNGHARFGGTVKNTGLVVDAMRKQGQGTRENTSHELSDFNAKSLTTLGGRHTLGLRYNFYEEESNLTYSGLRQSEWELNPRGNPFKNDFFFINRHGAAVTHTWAISPNVIMNNAAYSAVFLRDWWRQSSNSNQRPNRASDAACGGMSNLHTTCGNEGRLRAYYTWGIDPKFRATHSLFGVRSETDFGVRYHSESQIRIQKNGPAPDSRDGLLVEDNDRRARALSGFIQNRFLLGKFVVTPGLRLETVRYRRTNFLTTRPGGIFGETRVTQWIPGLGLAYNLADRITFFGGVHRGFAPPRVEDLISNSTGLSVDLSPELSWNYEAGLRGSLARDFNLEAAIFRMDFENQIIPASVAGGAGATLTNGGATRHQGAEFSGRWSRRGLPGNNGIALRAAYTWVPIATFEGRRFSTVSGFTNVLISGNRLPYAPAHLLTASLHYFHSRGFNAMVESVSTARQFGDDLNTIPGTPDGQRGLLPSNTLLNFTANYPVEAWKTTFFVTTKNIADRLAIVDRSRGLTPGMPRLVQAGVRFTF